MNRRQILALIALAAAPGVASPTAVFPILASIAGVRSVAADAAPSVAPADRNSVLDAATDTLEVSRDPRPVPDFAADTSGAAADSLPLRLRSGDHAADNRSGGELVEPAGVAIDAFGRLYVSDASLHRLLRYDAGGKWLGGSGALGSDPGQLNRPGPVAMLGTLGVAVLDRENRRVVTFDLFGQLQGTLIDLRDPGLEDALGRVDPSSFAADRGGALFVGDQERDRVLVFDYGGRFLRTLGGFGARPGSFRGLAGLATAPRGELVTTERGGARVQRLDAAGRVAASWPLEVRPGRLALPVAVDDSGRVAVADERSGKLWIYQRDGRLLGKLGGLEGPRALGFAPDGTLLVAEGAAGRVRRIVLERVQRPPAARGR